VLGPRLRAIVFTDLDHTMLGPQLEPGRAALLARGLWGQRVPVIPVTAKTIGEVILLSDKIGFPRGTILAGVENGAAIYATPGILPDPDRSTRLMGWELEMKQLAQPIQSWKHVIEDILETTRCQATIIDDPALARKLTGFQHDIARELARREYDLAVWSQDRTCLKTIMEKAVEAGFNAQLGSRILHIFTHNGKIDAVNYLLRVFRQRLGGPAIGLGDSPIDWDMLRATTIPIVVPRYSGTRQERLDPRFRVAREPAPEGWVHAVTEVLLSHV